MLNLFQHLLFKTPNSTLRTPNFKKVDIFASYDNLHMKINILNSSHFL